ncbi:MAG: uroporphyrinogen decarboxylase family protein [Verrucomicrobia bacterium]|jgi:MtaA/CmuA family methyltransferase|nr:uroporphyrinogen decarboxylase family protein [Verrucomicrobiota bacterium]
MTGLERTLNFLAGKPVDRPPFHPIIMRWAARYAGVKYREFCLDYRAKAAAMIKCADDFGIDWVTVMSDPWAEATAFGIQVEYPEDNLPMDVGGRLPDLESMSRIKPYKPLDNLRCANRINEIKEFKRLVGDKYFIVGWVEGPVAAYADIRGLSEAAMDFLDEPELCGRAMDVIVASAKEFITLQVQAGAHCIGIGDAFCSQIGPGPYRNLAFSREKELVDHIHSRGAKAKLHICGNTAKIMPDMIATGADILDVDHLVPTMADFTALLGPQQVFSGKCDPVSVIQNGTPAQILASVRECRAQAGGRVIVSAGCEVPPDTTVANLRAFRAAAEDTMS